MVWKYCAGINLSKRNTKCVLQCVLLSSKRMNNSILRTLIHILYDDIRKLKQMHIKVSGVSYTSYAINYSPSPSDFYFPMDLRSLSSSTISCQALLSFCTPCSPFYVSVLQAVFFSSSYMFEFLRSPGGMSGYAVDYFHQCMYKLLSA